jgi:hypothetical protein
MYLLFCKAHVASDTGYKDSIFGGKDSISPDEQQNSALVLGVLARRTWGWAWAWAAGHERFSRQVCTIACL